MMLEFDAINEPEQMPSGATIQERFEAFHNANPDVYRALVRLSLEMKRAGRQRYGVKGLVEKLRWDFAIQTQGDDFKISNDYTSRYARLIMEQIPELDGFFATRPLRAIDN